MTMNVYFNPLDISCKSRIGGIKEGEYVQFNIFLKQSTNKERSLNNASFLAKTPTFDECQLPKVNAFFKIKKDGEEYEVFPMKNTVFGWTISLKINDIGLYFYHFSIDNIINVSCGSMEMGYLTNTVQDFLLTVYSKKYMTPEWFKGGIMYQIFPDRFCKIGSMPDIKGRIERKDWGGEPSFRPNAQGKVLNNDFFGGNLKGIESKLSYLQELGVSVIYLNPIFEAASNHRYDTSDYMKIDPILGNEEDFSKLITEAKNKGIRIILDGVFNHTGDNSVYFNKYGEYPSVGAFQSKDSPYFSWYSFEEFPQNYHSWWGIDILPEVNEASVEYQNFIFGEQGVLKKWLRFGISGYRLDVADELPDFFLKGLRKSIKEENPDAIIIGEVWEDASNKIAYSKRREYLQGHELDSVMNYPLKDAIINYIKTENALSLLDTLRSLINHYPKQSLDCLMNILGTHDTARILTVLGGIYCKNKEEMARDTAYLSPTDKEKAIKKLKMAVILQFTLPGVPCIYYGDENGMEGHIDPFCRQCFDWTHLNEELINFYKKLGKIRKDYNEIFADGDFQDVLTEDGFILYKREKNHRKLYAYVNNSSKPQRININGNHKDCFSEKILKNEILVKPYSYGIFTKI